MTVENGAFLVNITSIISPFPLFIFYLSINEDYLCIVIGGPVILYYYPLLNNYNYHSLILPH